MTYTPTGPEIIAAYHDSHSWKNNLRWTQEESGEFLDVGDSAIRVNCTMDLDYWQADLLEVRTESTNNIAWIALVTKYGRNEAGQYKYAWAWADPDIDDLHSAARWWVSFVECECEDGRY